MVSLVHLAVDRNNWEGEIVPSLFIEGISSSRTGSLAVDITVSRFSKSRDIGATVCTRDTVFVNGEVWITFIGAGRTFRIQIDTLSKAHINRNAISLVWCLAHIHSGGSFSEYGHGRNSGNLREKLHCADSFKRLVRGRLPLKVHRQ